MKNNYLLLSLFAAFLFTCTTTFAQTLEVSRGSSGATANVNSLGIFETNGPGNFLSLLAPAGTPRGIIFGEFGGLGAIIYDSNNVAGGLDFRTNNNDSRMVIDGDGNVGIGTTSPTEKLQVAGKVFADIFQSDGSVDIDGKGAYLGISSSNRTLIGNQRGGSGLGGIEFVNYNDDNTLNNIAMTIDRDGNVGIGTTSPQSNLHIKQTTGGDPRRGIRFERSDNTNYWTIHTDSGDNFNFRFNNSLKAFVDDNGGNYMQVSDRKLKKNITLMDEVLPGVLQLQPKWYNYIDNETGASRSLGFIAQEVENIFPSFIFEKEGTKALAYDYFAVLSIKAIQELHAAVEEKDELIQSQSKKIEDLEARLTKIEALLEQSAINNPTISNSTTVITDAKLEQNQPNPFNGSTVVRYFIPQDVKRAELRVTDLTGKVIKNIAIQARGEGQTTFDATTLGSGTYQYSLFLDNQLLDTKQMVLTKN